MAKTPKLALRTGAQAKALRHKLGMNQLQFWSPVGVTQSGASRYESGRNIPRPVQMLLTIAYGTDKQSEHVTLALRGSRDAHG